MIYINGEDEREFNDKALAEAIIDVMKLCIEHHDGVGEISTEQFNNSTLVKKIEVTASDGAVYDIDVLE